MQVQPTETVRGRAMATATPARQELVTAALAAQAGPLEQRVDAIRQAAYVLYEARGGVYGHELEDWLKAEAEVDAQAQQGLADLPSAAAAAQPRP